MPPNAGVQIFTGIPVTLTAQAGADVSCPAATNTTALSVGGTTNQVNSPNVGSWIGRVWGVLFVDLGATPPTALSVFYATTAGTAIQSIAVPASQLVASAHLQIALAFLDSASATKWNPNSATPLIQVNPTAQTVTAKLGSVCIFDLVPGA